MVERNWYAVLGLTSSASNTDIKRAFRKLAHIYHPDKHNNPVFLDQYQQIQKAYDILGNPDAKQLYDNSLQLQTQFYGTQKTISDIHDMVTYCHKVERELQQADRRFINYDRIQWQLNQVIGLPQFPLILETANEAQQQHLLNQLLYCLKWLPYSLTHAYLDILQSTFAAATSQDSIHQFRQNKKWEARWDAVQLPIVAIISLLICYGIFYFTQ
jgi:curved DNA-binding protein CbpA